MAYLHDVPGVRQRCYPDLIRALIKLAREALASGAAFEQLQDIEDLVVNARQGLSIAEQKRLSLDYARFRSEMRGVPAADEVWS